MSTAAKRDLRLHNTGTNRVIIGPPAKSKGGKARDAIRFDAKNDTKVPDGKRLGQVHTIEGERAEALRKSPVVKAVADRLGLKAG